MLISLKIKVGNLSSGIQITDVQVKIITSMISLFRRWEALIRMPKSLLAGDILNPFRPQVYQVATNQNQVNALTDKLELKVKIKCYLRFYVFSSHSFFSSRKLFSFEMSSKKMKSTIDIRQIVG